MLSFKSKNGILISQLIVMVKIINIPPFGLAVASDYQMLLFSTLKGLFHLYKCNRVEQSHSRLERTMCSF